MKITDKQKAKIQIEVTETQLHLIKEAVEYLGRHALWQTYFEPTLLEDWIDEDRKIVHANNLLDMRKCIMHYNCIKQGEPYGVNVHQYEVMKMGVEPLITILESK